MALLQLTAVAVLGVLGFAMAFAAMAPLTLSAIQGLDHMLYGAEATSSELTAFPPAFFAIVALGLLLTGVAGSLMSVGMYRASRMAIRGELPGPRALFPLAQFGAAVAMNLARAALVLAQMLLLVAPGVIAAYRYSMADYLLAAHPEMGPIEVLRRSRERMRGRKRALFRLQLDFLGWALLCALPALVARILRPRWLLLSALLDLLSFAGALFLSAYLLTATTLFFRRADKKRKRRPHPDAPDAES